jgi:hypothetical protein
MAARSITPAIWPKDDVYYQMKSAIVSFGDE